MGGGAPLPSIQRYREEYLVDTETNEIIYPKVLPSSITIPPSLNGDQSNNGTITIPGISGGGGIDTSSYWTLRGTSSVRTSGNNVYYFENVPLSAGFWFLVAHLYQTSGAVCTSAAAMYISIFTGGCIGCDWKPSFAAQVQFFISTFIRIEEDTAVSLFTNSITKPTNFTVMFRGIKLADL